MVSIIGNFGSITFDTKKPPVVALTISNEMDDDTPVAVFALMMSNYNLLLHEHFGIIDEVIATKVMQGFTLVLQYSMRAEGDNIIDMGRLLDEVIRQVDVEKKKEKEKKRKPKDKVVHVDFSKKKKDE